MKKTTLGFVCDQFTRVPPVAATDLSGQTVIVVGANTGLGFEATKHLARMNPGRLILACRNKEKGAAAAYSTYYLLNLVDPSHSWVERVLKVFTEIREETRCQSVELQILDLSKFSSVIAFADNFLKDGSRLDLLVANAAVLTKTYKTTDDGWEES
jgi:NAD(P)-dependent dehydrogenase (short-subunit alcohol dehydrogenase family)